MNRKDWLEWRRSGIGGSDAPVVAGVSPWSTRLELFLEKKARLPEKPASHRMRLGLGLEPLIAAIFIQRTGVTYIGHQEVIRNTKYPWMIATLDCVTSAKEIVELKLVCPNSRKSLPESGYADGLPEYWTIQGNHQAITGDRDHVTFAALVLTEEDLLGIASFIANGHKQNDIPALMPDLDLRIYDVEASAALRDPLIGLESEFWQYVIRDEPPPELQAHDAATLASLFQGSAGWCELSDRDLEAADAYIRLGPQIRELEKSREESRARLLLSMGDATEGTLPDGRVVNRKVISIAESIRKASTQIRLSIKESR